MLDPRMFEDEPDIIFNNLARRQASPKALDTVDRIVQLNQRRRALILEGERLLALRNELSPKIGQLMKAGKKDEAAPLQDQVREATVKAKYFETQRLEVEATHAELILTIPNLLDPRVPTGESEEQNEEIRRWGTIPSFDFTPKTHDDLGGRLGILDFAAAARMSGARFLVLKGAGAAMERALISFFIDMHVREHGYTEVLAPYIVWASTMHGTGQLPKFALDMFKLSEKLNGQDAYLIPTAEVPVTNLHRGEILDESELPKAYVAFTPCFRAEAGTHGRDTKGLIRQHQFHKVELVRITSAEDSDAQHELLTSHAEECLKRLGLPYRVMRLCSADISFNARHCYDLEVWLPGQGAYREISSCSTFGDFQARRMATRYRSRGNRNKPGKPKLVHTINGSGLAVGRTLVAILENYQQADGSVVVPEALRSYLGGLDRIQVR